MLISSLLLALSLQAGKIYKCITPGGTPVYVSTPCAGKLKGNEIKLLGVGNKVDAPVPAAAAATSESVGAPSATESTPEPARIPGVRAAMPVVKGSCFNHMLDIKREYDGKFSAATQNIAELEARLAVNAKSWDESKESKVGQVWQQQLTQERASIDGQLTAARDGKAALYDAEASNYKDAKSTCPK
jgi:hypothetical protein